MPLSDLRTTLIAAIIPTRSASEYGRSFQNICSPASKVGIASPGMSPMQPYLSFAPGIASHAALISARTCGSMGRQAVRIAWCAIAPWSRSLVVWATAAIRAAPVALSIPAWRRARRITTATCRSPDSPIKGSAVAGPGGCRARPGNVIFTRRAERGPAPKKGLPKVVQAFTRPDLREEV